MADENEVEEQEEIVNEGAEETVTEGTEPPEGETEETPPGEGEPPAEGETEEGAEGEEEETEEPAYKANTKFKAGVYNKETKQLEQKEYDIDPRFQSLMTDADSEKAVRELHEKAFGLESVKERFNESKVENSVLRQDVAGFEGSINSLRQICESAFSPNGNIHKLDQFFDKLMIPQANILRWALAKVELNEMPPEQRNAIMGQLNSERAAEESARERDRLAAQTAELAGQTQAMVVDNVLARPEVSALQQEYDTRVDKPGAFKAAVYKEGMLAWHGERVELSPQQAVQRVIENYGLATGKHNLPPAPGGNAAPGAQAAGKRVVQRTNQTIPNINGNSQSPLAKKPKNMEEVLKYRKEQHGF